MAPRGHRSVTVLLPPARLRPPLRRPSSAPATRPASPLVRPCKRSPPRTHHDIDPGFEPNEDENSAEDLGLTLTASDALRLCVYTDCDNGTPMFTCTMSAMSPDGLPGFQFNNVD